MRCNADYGHELASFALRGFPGTWASPRGPETWDVGSLMSLLVVAMERKVLFPAEIRPEAPQCGAGLSGQGASGQMPAGRGSGLRVSATSLVLAEADRHSDRCGVSSTSPCWSSATGPATAYANLASAAPSASVPC